MSGLPIDPDLVARHNAPRARALADDYDALGARLARGGVDIDAVTAKVAAFTVAVPSWGVGTGGTRFARFPGPGEPRGVFQKLDDCAVIQQLGRATPAVSLHIPWDEAPAAELARPRRGARPRLRRDELQHVPGPPGRPAPPAVLQVRLAQPRRPRRAGAGGGPQRRLHPHRRGAGLQGPDGVDRRRLELPGPEPYGPRLRALPRLHAGDLRRPAGRVAALLRAQDVRAGLLLHRGAGLGHEPPRRAEPRAQGRLLWSTSATTRRTSTSR